MDKMNLDIKFIVTSLEMCERDVNLIISFTVRYLINLLIKHFGKVSNVFLPEAIFLTCFKKYSPMRIVMIYEFKKHDS